MLSEVSRRGSDHIPWPLSCQHTDAWRAYKAWKTNHYAGGNNYQTELLGKYGDVVRIGPNTVLVLDPEAINTVLGFKERLEKGPDIKFLFFEVSCREWNSNT